VLLNKILNIAIFLIATAFTCHAQVGFDNTAIHQLYDKCPSLLKTKIENEVTINRNTATADIELNWDGKLLIISHQGNIINHIGLEIPGIEVSDIFQKDVIRFLERALLSLSMENSVQDVVSCAEILQLKILYLDQDLIFSPVQNFNELYDVIVSSNQFNFTLNSNLILAEWINQTGSLKILFPGNAQLILGKNKKELDEEILQTLYSVSMDNPINDVLKKPETDLKTLSITTVKGSNYYDRISSDTYYYIDGKDSFLVFNSNYIPQSVSNLFLEDNLSGERLLKLEGKVYGGVSVRINIHLKSFNSFFKDDFEVFCGLENSDPENIEGTVIFRHKYYNFIHLLHFKSNSKEIFTESGVISSTFYPNIPMHNVNDLFSKTSEDINQPVIKFKIK
jgi:hypothetical protein